MRSKKEFRWLRVLSLAGFFSFLTWVAYMHQIKGGGAAGVPPIDALCPLGGLETLKLWASSGSFLRRTAPSALVLFAIVSAITLLFGRVFCGWICPLGAIGEFFAFIGRKLRLPKIDLPHSIDARLKLLKYLILIIILWGTVHTGTLIWRPYDPWVAWAHLAGGLDEILANPWSYVMLFGTVMGASLVIDRFWCRYLCPLGAALGIVATVSPLKVGNFNASSCTNCGLCKKACPVQLNPEKGTVSRAECLVCGECTAKALPRCDVQFRFAKKQVRVLTVGILTLSLFFGGYAVARGLGVWKTFVQPKVTADMTPDQIADSIFGWMSFKQIANVTGFPIEAIKEKSGVPQDTPEEESIKKLGIDDTAVKNAIREMATNKASKQSPNAQNQPTKPAGPSSRASSLPNPAEITGMMTLRDLEKTYGIKPTDILKEAGWAENLSPETPLRELKTLVGKEVEDIRQAVKRLIEQ